MFFFDCSDIVHLFRIASWLWNRIQIFSEGSEPDIVLSEGANPANSGDRLRIQIIIFCRNQFFFMEDRIRFFFLKGWIRIFSEGSDPIVSKGSDVYFRIRFILKDRIQLFSVGTGTIFFFFLQRAVYCWLDCPNIGLKDCIIVGKNQNLFKGDISN